MNENDNLVELGFCSRPHGIKGGFSFNLPNNEESILKKGFEVSLFPKDKGSSLGPEGEVYKISQISFGNKTIAYLEGVNDRNTVEAMLPFIIKVPRSAFPDTREGEFYLVDLVGLKVIDHETKKELGKVEGYYDNTAQIILKLSGGVEIPFLDQFVPIVDLEAALIEVNIPEIV